MSKYEAVRNWNEPQGSCQAWVIAKDGVVNPDKGYSSKAKTKEAIKKIKERDMNGAAHLSRRKDR